jgi:hypothetical protein
MFDWPIRAAAELELRSRDVKDLSVLGRYMTTAELAFVHEVDGVWDRLEQEYEAGLRSSNLPAGHPWTTIRSKHMLSCASDEELELFEKFATILERAEKEHAARMQPGNGNGHEPTIHRRNNED